MRGADEQPGSMFSYVSLEERVPKDHPLRAIRRITDRALERLSPRFDTLADRGVGVAVRQQQNDPGAPRLVSAPAARSRERLELGAFVMRQRQRSGREHATYYHSIND
jgi:hypothetical protein